MCIRDREETEIRLAGAGFVEPECWLEERVAMPEDPRGFMLSLIHISEPTRPY